MSETLLTIMFPTTVDRRNLFYPLLNEVLLQINRSGFKEFIEILIDEDSKEKSIGHKRQDLLNKATGTFVVGIDSDDWIASSYVEDIVAALQSSKEIDHVGFVESCNVNGKISKSIFSIKHKKWNEHEIGYNQVRCANPKSVIRRMEALQAGYPDLRFGEDRIFSEAVTPLLKSEIFINKPLYFYRHKSSDPTERYGLKK